MADEKKPAFEYAVAYGPNEALLIVHVHILRDLGYRPLGGVCVNTETRGDSRRGLYQAMIRENKELA